MRAIETRCHSSVHHLTVFLTTDVETLKVKDLGTKGMAVLLVNEGQTPLISYSLPVKALPMKHHPSESSAGTGGQGGGKLKVRDLYKHAEYCPPLASADSIQYSNLAPHDSVFLIVSAM
jgi:hypothetical protein